MTMPIRLTSGTAWAGPGLQFLYASAKLVIVLGRDEAMVIMRTTGRTHGADWRNCADKNMIWSTRSTAEGAFLGRSRSTLLLPWEDASERARGKV
jgi:hypothetical protein